MSVRSSRTPRRSPLAVSGTLLAALTLLLALPTTAQAAPRTAEAPERGTAYLGMGVVAHDGRQPSSPLPRAGQTEGVDVSGHQNSVNWGTLWNSGVKWAYVKATESTSYQNEDFAQQYNGSYNIGMIRGAYHFATPDTSSGASQAKYFAAHGGGWSKDGRTLPGMLDIEWNPYGASCYGLSDAGMVSWIRDFVNTYRSLTGRYAVIYTATSWWSDCTGNSKAFGSSDPLAIARYASSVGTLPAGWGTYTVWQYTSTGPTVGDHDHFNGTLDRVKALANG
ncbi:lysozyme [Streptomyces sp. TS71-3]|uniref:lysozyme n=1 Tax=Streptomyces sp. TS71-3 TaxID=2733862 RepID=UPI001B1A1762|nr:lysozyme [Streptomyces sp. TS71-3]GHJ35927.1 hydrolase [Streptomyces sp. TS71-3]